MVVASYTIYIYDYICIFIYTHLQLGFGFTEHWHVSCHQKCLVEACRDFMFPGPGGGNFCSEERQGVQRKKFGAIDF